MFRIDRAEQRSRTNLIIDGDLVREYVDVAERCCAEVLAQQRTVQVILRDVTSIDPRGKAWLRSLVRKGVRVMSRSLYTSYVVAALGREQ